MANLLSLLAGLLAKRDPADAVPKAAPVIPAPAPAPAPVEQTAPVAPLVEKAASSNFEKGPSPHFTWAETVITDKRLPNPMTPEQRENIKRHAAVLEEFRKFIGGKSMTISSWLRSPAVNRAVGGAANSAHLTGYATDVVISGMDQDAMCAAWKASGLPYNQLIREPGWMHVDTTPGNRREDLTKVAGGYIQGIHRV